MFQPDAFERHCDRFVTLCNQVVLPKMVEMLDELEAQGWVGDIQFSKGEVHRHRAPVEPEIRLTLLLLGGGKPVRAFVRLVGNLDRQAADVTVGRVGQKLFSQSRPMHEITAELVDDLVNRAAASLCGPGRPEKVLGPREAS